METFLNVDKSFEVCKCDHGNSANIPNVFVCARTLRQKRRRRRRRRRKKMRKKMRSQTLSMINNWSSLQRKFYRR